MKYENGKLYIGHSGDATAYVRQSKLLGYWRANVVRDRDIRQPFVLVPACSVDLMLEWAGFAVKDATWLYSPVAPLTELDINAEPDGTPEYVYFARKLGNGLVKIGYSQNPYERIKTFGADMRMLGLYPGRRCDEQEILNKFKQHCVEGEWFNMVKPIGSFVKQECYLAAESVYFENPRTKTIAEAVGEYESSKINA